jgi:hypothetical protein
MAPATGGASIPLAMAAGSGVGGAAGGLFDRIDSNQINSYG